MVSSPSPVLWTKSGLLRITFKTRPFCWVPFSGHDPRDSTSADEPVPDYTEDLEAGVDGMRIGIPKEYFIEGMDPDVETSVREAIAVFEQQGAEIHEISLPHTEYALPVYYILAPAEASSNLARYDGVRFGVRKKGDSTFGSLFGMYAASRENGFGDEVKRRIMLGYLCAVFRILRRFLYESTKGPYAHLPGF